MFDDNEFFREVALRLRHRLEIEAGPRHCISYLARRMPADALYLQRNEPDLDAMRIVARADAASCRRMDLLVSQSEPAKTAMAA